MPSKRSADPTKKNRGEVDIQAAAHELVKRTTAAQGLPEKVTDPVVIEQIARIMTSGRASPQQPAEESIAMDDDESVSIGDDADEVPTTDACWTQFLGEANKFGLSNPVDIRNLSLVAASRYLAGERGNLSDRWDEMRTRGFNEDMIENTHEILDWAPDLFKALDDLRRARGL
jgi:hypothetical protein